MADETKEQALKGTHAAENSTRQNDLDAIDDENLDSFPDLFTPEPESALPLMLEPADNAAAGKRERGRPPGSKNKKDAQLIQYLMGKGYHSPLEAGAALYNMPTEQLAARIAIMRQETRKILEKHGMQPAEINRALGKLPPVDPGEVLKFQAKVAADHLPYWHTKQSPDEAPPDRRLPVMMIGELNVQQINRDGSMSAGVPPEEKIVEHQPLSETPERAPDE